VISEGTALPQRSKLVKCVLSILDFLEFVFLQPPVKQLLYLPLLLFHATNVVFDLWGVWVLSSVHEPAVPVFILFDSVVLSFEVADRHFFVDIVGEPFFNVKNVFVCFCTA
jgi:hypothetical protein